MKISTINTKNLLILTAVIVMATFSWSNQVMAAPGAIFTTEVECSGVNINQYTSKAAVYLNGGPNGGGPGLPEGDYYVQVTEPDGTVLGHSGSASAHVDENGEFAQCYQLSAILFTASSGFTVGGYDTTTNNGNEYKVWASKDPNFANNQSKTDNFKVKEEVVCAPDDTTCNQPPPPISISGYKFYDTNQNAVFNEPGEVSVPGWKMTLFQGATEVGSTMTDSDGKYEFIVDPNTGNYTVKEELRGADNWINITDPPEITVDSATDHTDVNFGNIRKAQLSGLKFRDLNMDGDQDSGEETISGITIEITTTEPPTESNPNPTPQLESTSTDANGGWVSGLHPIGTTYSVCENVNAAQYLQTAPGGDGCHSGTLAFSSDSNGDPEFFAPVDVGNLNFGNIALFRIGGIKYYDADQSGAFSTGDSFVVGIKINISIVKPNAAMASETTFSQAGGVWESGLYPEGSTFSVTETLPVLPNGSWTQTAGTTAPLTGTINGAVTGLNFFNYCSLRPGGHTLGFWSNKNGLSNLDANDFNTLNILNLRNANGSNRDFNEGTLDNKKKAFNSWILSANATNMAYMLSAQLAATKMSVDNNPQFTNPNVIVDGMLTVSQLISYGNGLLGANGNTVASGTDRTEQGRVKDILDKINNNGSFLQPVACSVNY